MVRNERIKENDWVCWWSYTHKQLHVASFILFSAPGSGNNMITVFAESRVNAERTLRALNHLVKFIHMVTFTLCLLLRLTLLLVGV